MFDEFGKFNYKKFCEDFHEPAMQIGFNLAVLLTNLREHMSSEPRLNRYLEMAEDMFEYFKPYLGRIEIIGQEKKIERIYFEIKESSLEQWEKPQIRDSKREFIFDVVNSEGGETGKMEAFVDFCEDTIFEMQLASSISETKFTADDDDDIEEDNIDDEEAQRGFFGSMTTALKFATASFMSIFTWRFMKRSYKFARRLTIKDIIVFLLWLCILVPLKILKRLFFMTIVNAFVIIKFAIDGELVAQIKKTSWTELLYEFPEPCQDGIQGYADNDPDEDEQRIKNQINLEESKMEEESEEILDDEQQLAKTQREKLLHDREMIQLCVWKPPMTGFGDMTLEEAAEALGLYEDEGDDWNSATSRRPSQCDEHELMQIREATEAAAVHRLAQILGLKHKKDNTKMNLTAEDLPQWQWYKHKKERPSKYQPDTPVPPSTLADMLDKFNHFINCLVCLFARYFYSIKDRS